MSESETVDETKQETNPRKRIRHRKKQLYDNILKQIEFYFSDANLAKDRFLGSLIKNDPYVPIETFLKFNKIRSMTQNVSDIAKALSNSNLLECSEDQLKVKRKTPPEAYNADERTVYVESIPATASREWLQSVFKDYGPVAYISLPKFKNTQKIKGYAFIEYEKPEGAQRCLDMLSKMGCKLPTSMPPEQLSTIRMFSVEEPSEEKGKNKENKAKEAKPTGEVSYEPPKKKQKKIKDKKKKDEKNNTEDNPETVTQSEADSSIDEDKNNDSKEITEEQKSTDVDQESESKDEASSQDDTAKEEDKDDRQPEKKKKTRKRTTKERNKSKNNIAKKEAPKGALWGLQVLSKAEWKSLRNKYLNLQRKHMKDLKSNLRKNGSLHVAMPLVPNIDKDASVNVGGGEESKRATEPLEKTPGVFVKAELSEPCLDVRLTKRQVRSNVHVQHVDVKEGTKELVIRFDTAEAAQQYCSSGVLSSARVLCGAEEAVAWECAEAARSSRKVRGRNRLLQRAARVPPTAAPPRPTSTHVRFDE